MKFLLVEGFVSDKIWYHGSPHKFNNFDSKMTGKSTDFGTLGTGCYFTDDYEQAKHYAKNGYVYKCRLNVTNSLIIKNKQQEKALTDATWKDTEELLNKEGEDSPRLAKILRKNIDEYTKPYDAIFAYWANIPEIILDWNEACVKDTSKIDIIDVISMSE